MSITLTRQEAKAILSKPKRSKYNAQKTVVDGIEFHSRKEAERYSELKKLLKAGEISHLELQPKFYLYGSNGPVLMQSARYPNGRRATWRGDFAYFCSRRNKRICEDVKGMRTDMYLLKKAIVQACYPGLEIVEI